MSAKCTEWAEKSLRRASPLIAALFAVCCRKNPLHFQECSHPGDTDYEEEEEEEETQEADRPECPYGTDCYRSDTPVCGMMGNLVAEFRKHSFLLLSSCFSFPSPSFALHLLLLLLFLL